jgi:hypothetical protein
MYRDILGFSISPHMQRIMAVDGCYASIMRAEKKAENNDRSLPPGLPIPVLPVDYLKERPEHWIGGEGSYVCPVDSDWALWFNWSMNNTSETAVLCSVKGMNPLTGQRLSSYDLQDFRKECPIHNVPFSTGKLCSKCGFKWPDQNFISSPDPLYIDGYCMPDGDVRQFYFTEEMAKSIPEKVIGKDDTVPAFGFCFYKLKNCRTDYENGVSYRDEFPSYPYQYSYPGSHKVKGIYEDFSEAKTFFSSSSLDHSFNSALYEDERSSETRERSISFSNTSDYMNVVNEAIVKNGFASLHPKMRSFSKSKEPVASESFEVKNRIGTEVGLGAGARIKQRFGKAKHPVSDWEKEPTGVVRLYFVFQEEFERYAAAGLKDLEGSREGYLDGLPVGGEK